MADELDTGLAQTTPETPAEATPPSSPSTAPAAAAPTASTAAEPAQQTPAGQAATPAAPSYASARDFAAKALGYKADVYNDDESFLRAVVAGEQTLRRQLDEARQLAQYGHLYLQQQQPKKADPDKPDPLARYKAPEFNQQWLSMVEKDEQGNLRLRPGADPAILPKLHAYQNHQAEVVRQMTSDPAGYLKDLVENIAAEKAQSLFQEQFQKIQGDQYVNTFLKDNSGWLLQQDSQGRVVQNPATGQAMLTPAGGRFLHYMQEAEQLGIANPVAQERYAMNGLKAELYTPAAQATAAVDAGEKQKQALLQTMNRGNKSGSMTPPESGGPATQNAALSLGDRLRALPDEVFAAAVS